MSLMGVPVNKYVGERVGRLGEDWREVRRQNKALFYKVGTDFQSVSPDDWEPGPVRVWFQEKATECAIIASKLSDLWRGDGV